MCAARPTGTLRQLYPFLLERRCRLVERGPRPDRRLQADPGLGGDHRRRRAAGPRRADRLRRRGRGPARPSRTGRRARSAASSTSATAAGSTTGCCSRARATSARGRASPGPCCARALREAPAELPGSRRSLAASWLGYRAGLLGPSPAGGAGAAAERPGLFLDLRRPCRRRRRAGAGLSRPMRLAVPHQQPLPAARGHRAARARGGAAACSSAATRSPSSPAARAFARWRESSVAGTAGPPLPALSRCSRSTTRWPGPSSRGWLRDGADGADLLHVHLPLLPPLPTELPIVATFHSPMLADTGAIGEPGLRPALIKANARLFSRRYEQWYLDRAAPVRRGLWRGRGPSSRRAIGCAGASPSVVPNGVDTEFFGFASLKGRGPGRPLCRPARLPKGLFRLLDAFARLPRRHRARADPGRRRAAGDRPAPAGGGAGDRRAGPLRRASSTAWACAASCATPPASSTPPTTRPAR